MRVLVALTAFVFATCNGNTSFADERLPNIRDFEHKILVLNFLDAVARKDSFDFSKLITPDARLEGFDRRIFRELDAPLTLENSQEMIEKCQLLDITQSYSTDIETHKLTYRTLVSWDCGKVLGEQSMYITFEKGLVSSLNPFGPPAIRTVLSHD